MFETITKQQSIFAVQYRTTTPYSHQSDNKLKEKGGKHWVPSWFWNMISSF